MRFPKGESGSREKEEKLEAGSRENGQKLGGSREPGPPPFESLIYRVDLVKILLTALRTCSLAPAAIKFGSITPGL